MTFVSHKCGAIQQERHLTRVIASAKTLLRRQAGLFDCDASHRPFAMFCWRKTFAAISSSKTCDGGDINRLLIPRVQDQFFPQRLDLPDAAPPSIE